MSYYKDQLKIWLKDKSIDADKVLSVGNLNDDSKYFKSFKVNEVETIDIDETFKPTKVADMNESFITEDLHWLSNKDKYDHIFTFELWEYIWNPFQALGSCNYLLKKGGKLWVSAPFIYPTHNPKDMDYLRYTEYFWKNIPEKLGFKVIEYQRRRWADNYGIILSMAKDGMRPAKDYNHDITGHLVILEKL